MRQASLFGRAEIAAMRDRTASRNHSPARDEFRREHERHRAWGLQRRHAEKLRRLRQSRSAAAPAPTLESLPPHPTVPPPPVPAARRANTSPQPLPLPAQPSPAGPKPPCRALQPSSPKARQSHPAHQAVPSKAQPPTAETRPPQPGPQPSPTENAAANYQNATGSPCAAIASKNAANPAPTSRGEATGASTARPPRSASQGRSGPVLLTVAFLGYLGRCRMVVFVLLNLAGNATVRSNYCAMVEVQTIKNAILFSAFYRRRVRWCRRDGSWKRGPPGSETRAIIGVIPPISCVRGVG